MQVKQIQDVRTAEIDKLSRIQAAEGDRQATIVRAEGTKQQYILEGDGEGQRAKFIGQGEAAAIQARGLAEGKAKEAVAEGMNVLARAGKDYRTIDYLQAVQTEFARAMQSADIKFISTQPPGRFLELFTPSGGASIGGALSALNQTGGTEEIGKIVQGLKSYAPGLYDSVKKALTEGPPPEEEPMAEEEPPEEPPQETEEDQMEETEEE